MTNKSASSHPRNHVVMPLADTLRRRRRLLMGCAAMVVAFGFSCGCHQRVTAPPTPSDAEDVEKIREFVGMNATDTDES